MNEILFIARSVTHAQRMVRALEQCGIRSFLLRTPAGLTGGGCSYAVKVRGQRQQEAQKQQCGAQGGRQPFFHGVTPLPASPVLIVNYTTPDRQR